MCCILELRLLPAVAFELISVSFSCLCEGAGVVATDSCRRTSEGGSVWSCIRFLLRLQQLCSTLSWAVGVVWCICCKCHAEMCLAFALSANPESWHTQHCSCLNRWLRWTAVVWRSICSLFVAVPVVLHVRAMFAVLCTALSGLLPRRAVKEVTRWHGS